MFEIPLSPVIFLDRAASVFGEVVAIVDGEQRFTYREFGDRSHRIAGLLRESGVGPGDRVAALCTNSHVMLELHYAVPILGAALVPLNIRLSVGEMAHIVKHSGARLIIATQELYPAARQVSESSSVELIEAGTPESEYESRLKASKSEPSARLDERSLIAINYTSGTTGLPKGVMCSHRGAYLQALALAYHTGLAIGSSYLWTLPMFHCNGWCFTWAVTAAGGTHICQRRIDPNQIWRTICSRGITHLSGAPTLLLTIAEAAGATADLRPPHPVRVQTGGAPPTPALLARLAALDMQTTHFYGLTETYGPAVVNAWHPEWSRMQIAEQARLNARQGVANVAAQSVTVVDAEGRQVQADGETVGEIVVTGNNVMLGYYRDEGATRAVEIDGGLRTGDLGVRHPDGYVELTDRAKDIIITGGENVASVEVERVLTEHPAVLEVAVVGRPDARWGEVPVAFVVLKPGKTATEGELIAFVRDRIAHFKAPKEIRFEALPKTSTGKIQKKDLRERVASSPARQTES
ncbi:MAG TPA: AMP-binding protein [Patescibacteria group bacterium]|nr:AMP-binding protein [Patescibacteria group bacterium]